MSTKQVLINKYGEDEGLRRWDAQNLLQKNRSSTKVIWITKYGEVEGLRKWEELRKKYGRTKEQYIKEHGEVAWEELKKKKRTVGKDIMIEKYGTSEGIKRWNGYLKKWKAGIEAKKQRGWKNGLTLEEYQKRYGVGEGYKRWKKRNKNHSYMVSKQRYIDEYGEVVGKQMCKELKNNSSLTSFVERYGEKVGKLRYEENCKNCAITIDKMTDIYGEEIGKEKYKEWLFKITETTRDLMRRGVSKSSQELFWGIYDELKYKESVYFAELNKEYQFFVNNENGYPNKIISVDFKLKNKIIEFDGEYWHNKTLDEQRDNLLESKGYYILRIDYHQFMKDKTKILNNCMRFLNERT